MKLLDERRLKSILDRLHDGFMVLDREWRCLYVNEKAATALQRSVPDLTGKVFWEVCPEMMGSPLDHELRRALADQLVLNFDHFSVPAQVWYEVALYPSQEDVSILLRDIFQRKHVEDRLSDSDGDFRDFFENSVVGLQWMGPDGRVLRVNQAGLDMLGYTREGYAGHLLSEFCIDPGVSQHILARLASKGTIREYEARLRCKDGNTKDVLMSANVLWKNGKFVHARLVMLDITGRKRWEMSQAELAAIVETSEDAIIIETLEGTVIGWNAGAARLFGYPASEAIGQPATFLMPTDRTSEEVDMVARLSEGRRIKSFETLRRGKDKELIPVSVSLSPIKDENGKIIGAAKIIRDITERQRAEDELRDKLRDLELFHDMAVERELKLVELKKELQNLKNRP